MAEIERTAVGATVMIEERMRRGEERMAVASVEVGGGQLRSWQCDGLSCVGGKGEGEGADIW